MPLRKLRFDTRWIALAIFFVILDWLLITIFKPGSDWAPLWTAGRMAWDNPAQLYDFDLIARLQGAVVDKVDFHPFIYPPSALLLISPLALFPFWHSLWLLAVGSIAWLAATARRVGSDPRLVLFAPPVVIAAIVGQTSLLVIGLVALGCVALDKDEHKAGALFALATLIKPTLLVLAPVGLVAGRHWRALGWSLAVGLAGVALSMLLFGIRPWFDWFEAIPAFQRMFDDYPPLVRNAVSPYALAVRLGFASPLFVMLGAMVAAAFVWIGFSRPASAAARSALVMGGALLLTPYAMNYELAVFAPALLALPRESLRNLLVCALWGLSLFITAGLLGLLVAYAAVAAPLVTKRA
ncbi:MAG TPA: glycosyltransferase family 87 protein [Sphingomicrobium sp.]|nr:glycosyltransferase family 87 protein [Sphingomicrobium sp.]